MPNVDGKVDLPALLKDLAARGVNELHVEAGHKLNGSLLREGCVDELLVYLAPKLIGSGLDIASHLHAGGPLTSLAGALPLEFKSVRPARTRPARGGPGRRKGRVLAFRSGAAAAGPPQGGPRLPLGGWRITWRKAP